MTLLTLLEQSSGALLCLLFVLGLIVGSFLNVVIYRLPIMLNRQWREECCEFLEIDNTKTPEQSKFNLSVPRSTCPNCEHQITALENIPVISYLFLGSKCSACSATISIRYPSIELLTGILSVICGWYFGFSIETLMLLLLTWSLICLSLIDFDHQILPDNITLPMLWLGILCNYFGLFTDLNSSILGAIFGYMAFWSVYIIFKFVTGKEGMGHGDFKLLSMFGAWLGWQYLLQIIIVSSFLGAIAGIALMIFHKHKKSKPIPFGPYIAIAGWIAIFWGDQLNTLYLNWAQI